MQGSADRAARPEALGLSPTLAEAGINAAGVLCASDYDERVGDGWKIRDLLPAARSVVVLATGGGDLYRAFVASRSGPPSELARERDPLDAFVSRAVEAATRDERGRGGEAAAAYYHERRGPAPGPARFADFVALAAAAGLGAPSRLGLLIHPVFGPWIAIRAVLLLSRRLDPTRADASFAPCTGCPAPCETACPGSAVSVRGFDLSRCTLTTAREAPCRVGCASRRACVFGRDHRYSADAEAYHRSAAIGPPRDPHGPRLVGLARKAPPR